MIVRIGMSRFALPGMDAFRIKNTKNCWRNFPFFRVSMWVYLPESLWVDIDKFQRFEYRRVLSEHSSESNVIWKTELDRLKKLSGGKLIWEFTADIPAEIKSKYTKTRMIVLLGSPCGITHHKWSWLDCRVIRPCFVAVAQQLNLMIYGLWRLMCIILPFAFPRNGSESLNPES